MNTDKLITTLVDAIMSEPIISRDNIEKLVRTHVNIENKRASRQRNRVHEQKELETLSEVIDLRFSLKIERDLAKEETRLWKLKVQDILKSPEKYSPQSYAKMSEKIRITVGKIKDQKLRDAGRNKTKLHTSRRNDINLTKKLT